jgi:fatty-acyl-CoA synthase
MKLEDGTGPASLGDALIRRVRATPDLLAYTFAGEGLTFAGLVERAGVRAAALQRLGVTPTDRVAIAMAAGLPFLEVFWAVQLLGAVPCALNPSVPTPAQERRIRLVRPKLTITDDSAQELTGTTSVTSAAPIGRQDLAFLQLTSGTSGEPRVAMVTHNNVIAFLEMSDRDRLLRADDVLVSWLPAWHDLGLVRFVLTAVWNGVTCHLLPPAIWSIPDWLVTVSETGGTVTAAPDTAYRLATRMTKAGQVDLSSLRYAVIGAEPVRLSTIEAFEARFSTPNVIMPAYGLAEAVLGVTFQRPDETRRVDRRGNVSSGRPMSGLDVVAGTTADAPEEILVRGDIVFAGYFGAPDETSWTLRDGWLHTGDIGYADPDGSLYVLGRRSGMIKRLGSVVAPRELEEVAEQVEGVRLAAATSLPAAGKGAGPSEEIVVAVEKRSDRYSDERIRGEIFRRIRATLGFAPGRILILPGRTIPRTSNGKVRHRALRELMLAGLGR